jgi:cellulose synthase operon protein C
VRLGFSESERRASIWLVASEPEPLHRPEPRALPGPAWGRAESTQSTQSLDQLAELEHIPLRLKVSRGALGIELSEPLKLGPLVVEAYEWALSELEYPLDLSGGVKQFVDRQGTLERVKLTLRLSELRGWLLAAAEAVLGPEVDCRVRATEIDGEVEISCSLWAQDQALAFHLVLGSALQPRIVVDQARGFGLGVTPLTATLQLLDSLGRRAAGASWMMRRGRSISLALGVDALSLELLPALGCRMPELGAAALSEFSVVRGDLTLTLGVGEEPVRLGRRGLRLGGLAESLARSDDALLLGQRDGARREYLSCLEDLPGCPEVLLELSRLDLLDNPHTETAQGYLEAARDRLEHIYGVGTLPGTLEAMVAALEGEIFLSTGRRESGLTCLRRAAELESDPSLAAFLLYRVATADRVAQGFEIPLLDLALERAPHFVLARWSRVEALLFQRGREPEALDLAALDIERLHALAKTPADRVTVLLRAAKLLVQCGAWERALRMTRRGLLVDPGHAEVALVRGELLLRTGEPERAIELLRGALQTLRRVVQDSLVFSSFEHELIDRASVALAQALVDALGDYSEAIRLVSAVDSRSAHALIARRLECAYARALPDARAFVRAVDKVLEAVELGWLPASKEGTAGVVALVEELEASSGDVVSAGAFPRLRALANRLLDPSLGPDLAEPTPTNP